MSSQVLRAAHKDIHNTYTSAHASITGYGCKPLEAWAQERRMKMQHDMYTCWQPLTRVALISSSYLCSLCCKVSCNCRKMIVSHNTAPRWRNTAPLLHISNTANSEKNCMHHSKYSNGRTYVCTYAGSSKEPCTYVHT